MNDSSLPIVGITIGDPAGIGTEVTVKCLTDENLYNLCRPLVIGSLDIVQATVGALGLPLQTRGVLTSDEARFQPRTVDVLDVPNLQQGEYQMGVIDARVGRASIEYTERAVDLALAGNIEAICSAPVNKEAMHLAGYDFPGQTELLAQLTGAKRSALALLAGQVRVFFVTNHVGLRQACELITAGKVLATVEIAHRGLEELGIAAPLLGVAGLNPHCGEGGLFGREEIDEISPALEEARRRGIRVEGPIPGDVIFSLARAGRYEAVIAMYHDQGNIPIKVLMERGAVTLVVGLPVVRTSVAHGTAYDIAGKGLADPSTMKEAIRAAAFFAARRKEAAARSEG